MRATGTIARGIRTPIIKEGDKLVEIVVESILKAAEEESFSLRDKDVVGITESIVARAQGNYISTSEVAQEIKEKFSGEIGVLFPILSRNRFALILEAIIKSGCQVHLQLNYPRDEVGNPVLDPEKMRRADINPPEDVISYERYKDLFSDYYHPYTGVNYVELYKKIGGDNIKIYLANKPEYILKHTDQLLAADIHSRNITKKKLRQAGAKNVLGLDDLCTEDRGRGYNPEFGLLGSNRASRDRLKLFPREGEQLVRKVKDKLKKITGKEIEVMIYGDGAYKDPGAKIWELADPVVSPAYTDGLEGTPQELKLKYLADNELEDLEGEELLEAVKQEILHKEEKLTGEMKSQGTTPRHLPDLLGSLADLISGSGDKGTPVVLIQGYFDSLAEE